MGVYIPNMEMPKSCWGCELLSSCKAMPKNPTVEEIGIYTVMRLKDCPLIEMDEEVFRHLKGCAFIVKALYKKLKEKYKCAEEDEEGIEEDFDPYQGDRDRDTFGEIY